ncbi:hypothetical protein SNEBB_003772, partial [Seison nebaliae]
CIDCLKLKQLVDDLTPRELFDGDKIIYELEKTGRESWKVTKLTVTSRPDKVERDCSSETFDQVLKATSQILSLSISFQCFGKNPETVLAILRTGDTARAIWDLSYCVNTYKSLADISSSTSNFCHLDAFTKQYDEIHLIFMNTNGEVKRNFKFRATHPVTDKNWFSASNAISYLKDPFFSCQSNYLCIQQLNTLLSNPFYIYNYATNGNYRIRCTTGPAKTIQNMKLVDLMVIAGIEN